ncbi:MAG TPA: class I SAM-dependent methyltransferase [Chitinophagaceae bacterium]|nr:class I SAM-dependent methyltransferase [Chitinophagaceae bacterium]
MAKDLFSKHAETYARWRPGYPAELIDYIVSLVHGRDTAWDCATGNGQAAVLLAGHFDQVFATDLSSQQLQHAKQHPNITYSQSPAEQAGFADNTFDLVTVAQAYHWFDQPAFCREATRVCKPGAIVAIWSYHLLYADDAIINDHIRYFYTDVTDPYWDAARKYVDDKYRTVYFDFEEIAVHKEFSITVSWSIEDLSGYLNSWSAVQKYISVNAENPVTPLMESLQKHWPAEAAIDFVFPLAVRIGRVKK